MSPAAFAIDARSHPRLGELRRIFRDHHRFSRDIIDRAAASFGEAWAADCEETLASLFPTPGALGFAARGYAAFAMDAMRRQALFEKERTYPAKSHAAASSEVYLNADHMMSEYLPGLLLSHFLWPHHYRQLQFFRTGFVERMRIGGAAHFTEIGVGTGLYSRRILQDLPQISGHGIDISPSVKRFAEWHLQSFELADRYQLDLRDIVEAPLAEPAEWLLCVEVLEHLDDPLAFLRALRQALKPGGSAFITAALNAASADHIYLYRTAEEVLQHLSAAGFVLEQYFLGAAYKPAAPGLPVPLVAAFVVV
jgi:SAM-dependent methyltransferase